MNNELFTTKELCQLFKYITPKILDGLKQAGTIKAVTVFHEKPAKFDYSNTVYVGYINALHSVLRGKSVLHLAKMYTLEDWLKYPCRVVLFNHAIRYCLISPSGNKTMEFLSIYGEACKELMARDSEDCFIYYLDSPAIFKRITESIGQINTASFKPYYAVLFYKIEEQIQKYIEERNSLNIQPVSNNQKTLVSA